jgi:class 3 adenylate cyclase
MMDLSALSMTEIIRLQNQLQQELKRRFERPMTLAFSDIVGSTPYFARFGDAAGRQLQQLHIDLLNECLLVQEGRIVDTAGDGAFLAFPTADAAAQALMDFQKLISYENAKRARDQQLQVRIGVHLGPVLTDGVVVSGDSVNLCSRVAASANIGEIRLTREVFQELALAHRLNCRPVGLVDLKGVSRQVELLVLDWWDHLIFPTQVRIEETNEVLSLPQQDIISFGRLREHEGTLANDVVLAPADPLQASKISRWHFELRRFPNGFRLRPVSEVTTEVDGELITKGSEVTVKPGARICVARVLTLTLVSPPRNVEENSEDTRFAG